MKYVLLLFISMGSLSINASAHSSVPDCWQESSSEVADGKFLVGLDTTMMKTEELVQILKMLRSEVLWADNYPIIFESVIYVPVSAQPRNLSRSSLKRKVAKELQAVLHLNAGVSVACDGLVGPQPGIGVRN